MQRKNIKTSSKTLPNNFIKQLNNTKITLGRTIVSLEILKITMEQAAKKGLQSKNKKCLTAVQAMAKRRFKLTQRKFDLLDSLKSLLIKKNSLLGRI